MPFARPSDMLPAEPLPGWSGRFLHSATMTYDIAAAATPLHEHQQEQDAVWHIVDGEEQVPGEGCIAVVPPDISHWVRPLGACRVVVADYPRRPNLPGLSPPQ